MRPPGRHRRHEHPRVLRMRRLFLALVFAALLVLPGSLLTQLYHNLTGQPITLPVQAVCTLVWFLTGYFLLTGIASLVVHSRFGDNMQRAPNLLEQSLEAIDRIAMGDYNVRVEQDARLHHGYRELAEKVNKLARDLSSVEQMRQEFVSNVSHEIQSPLTSISGFAALLKSDDLPRDQRLHYLEIIEAESKRLSGLSDNLLKLSVLESEQAPTAAQPFALDKQLQDVLLVLEPQWMEKGLEPDLSLEPVTITGDKDLLSQVWINLLHNSIKFTPPGGTLTVSLAREGDEAVCVVADTGIGIPEESLVHIFERFYKADKARDRSLGGNGLGLSLVGKIVELHGGRIAVASSPGAGTTFTVRLPMEPKTE